MITPISVLEGPHPTSPSTIHHHHHNNNNNNNNNNSQSASLVKCWTERENSPVFTITTSNIIMSSIIASNKYVEKSIESWLLSFISISCSVSLVEFVVLCMVQRIQFLKYSFHPEG